MIFLLTISLFSKARSDVDLADIDVLIEQRRINEAVVLVEKYLSENLFDFDNAQKRVNIILKFRHEYKLKADELLRIIVEEPLNDVKKLEIIADLEAMEANPSEEEKLFIQEIKIASQFTYYRALLDQIFSDATELIAQKQYVAATVRLSDGFVLYYADFFDKGFDPAFVVSVEEYLADIMNALSEYKEIQEEVLGVFGDFNSELAKYDVEESLRDYRDLEQVLGDYAQIRNASFLAGLYFKDSVLSLKEEFPDLTEAFFVPFAQRLVLGSESDDSPGIITVMDTQWNDLYAESQKLLTGMIEYYSNIATQNLADKSIEQLVSASTLLQGGLATIEDATTLSKDFLGLYTLLNDSSTTFTQNPHTEYENSLDYNEFLVRQTEALLEYSLSFITQQTRYENITVPENSGDPIQNNNTEYVDFLVEYSNNTALLLQNVDIAFFDVQKRRSQAPANATVFVGLVDPSAVPWDNFAMATEEGFVQLSEYSSSELLLSWEALSSFFAQGATFIREEYESMYTEAIFLVNENMDATMLSYPAESLVLLEDIMQTISVDLTVLQEQYDFLETAPQSPIVVNPGSNLYVNDKKSIVENIALLNTVKDSVPDYIPLANNRIILARQAENEGNLRFSQAQNSLDQQNFDASRDSLQRARVKYNESFLYQESETLRTQSDSQLAVLGAEINRLENDLVVQDVRQFITDSRNQYYNSNFTEAESLIVQAETRWAVTNIEQNEEVVALKSLIGNALSLTTGRVILSTDPLYPEMSQTLNVAHQYFDQGEESLLRNNRDEGLAQLSIARNRLRDVQVLYPFNQEASLLSLQIDKLIDPSAFEVQFAQKYKTAQDEYRNADTSTQAYIDLLDLYEINSAYLGLEDFIYVVEVELGILPPPIDFEAIAESEELTNQAARMYASGARDEISLNSALALLKEAIAVNPQNTDATVLLDRINTNLGGQSVIVLSANEEALYQQAVQELSRGNTITAFAIVDQLWQLPGMQQAAKIIDLKNRVDSLL